MYLFAGHSIVRLSATVPDFPTVLYGSRICDRPLLSPTELSPQFPTSPLSIAVSSCMLLCPTTVPHCPPLFPTVFCCLLLLYAAVPDCLLCFPKLFPTFPIVPLQLPPTIPSHCSFLFLLSPTVLHLLSLTPKNCIHASEFQLQLYFGICT